MLNFLVLTAGQFSLQDANLAGCCKSNVLHVLIHGFVVVFVDNWNKFNKDCKAYLNADLFQLRIGFCLNEKDAGSLLGEYSLKGLDDGRKVIFVNRQRNV